MESVNIHQAKTHLSRLLSRVEGGEEILIARSGVPVARLVPIDRSTHRREGGQWKGRVRIADDFDELPGEVRAAFDGERP